MKLVIIASFALIAAVYSEDVPAGHTVVAQCKCSDLEECGVEVKAKTDNCKKQPKCTDFLKQIGDATKIMACLDADHVQMMKVETCAKKKLNGELGCTNSETPVNMTIPLIPVIEVPSLEEAGGAQQGEGEQHAQPQPPMQLSQYLMCIDECAHDDMDVIPGRKKRSPATCAFKLKCALAPPSEQTQNAYTECQKELNFDPVKGAADSCKCLKDAGVAMQC
ncbi:unnamed protein product [Caenorhabditis angaria]|uniref:DUF19 domain-containing protein n=1 Tax=Caenorhabditis angaria TaxID=860376 RepID=A0A9P1IY02_9PELO|nr:unnamed protein product [Caenorhabditis angaria]